jgi:hypothetical protein
VAPLLLANSASEGYLNFHHSEGHRYRSTSSTAGRSAGRQVVDSPRTPTG